MFAEVAKIGEVAVNSAEKLSEIKEVELKDNLSKPKERDVNETITVKEEVKNILK